MCGFWPDAVELLAPLRPWLQAGRTWPKGQCKSVTCADDLSLAGNAISLLAILP